MVIDNLTVADLSFPFVWNFVLNCGLVSLFHSELLMIFRCLLILGLDVRSMLNVSGL